AVLRELRAGLHHLRGPADVRAARAARLRLRSGSAAPSGDAAHARHHLQQPEQSNRQGLLARRAPDDRRPVPRARSARHHRRDLRAHRLRRSGPHADRHLAGHGRAHDHDLRHLEVLLRDGAASGLRDRPPRAAGRHPARPRFRHRRRTAPPAGSRRHRAPAPRLVLRQAARGLPGAPRPALGLYREGRVRGVEAARRLLHPDRRRPLHEKVRRARRHRVRDVAHQARRGRGRAGLVLLRPHRARPYEDPVLLPEDRRHASGRGRAPPQPRLRTSRDAVRAIWEAALAAGDVAPLVRACLRLDRRPARVFLLGAGKASGAMAAAAEDVLADRVAGGFVVVKDGYGARPRRTEGAGAGPPGPDSRGLATSERLLELARAAGEDDLIVFLVSGGGSALTPAPAPPITLAEKQELTRLLLASGVTIGELNAVRKHLSLVKGGQLARAAWPARVLTLALSDVIGDPLDVIASGPTAPDPTTFADALEVLARRGLSGRVPASIARRLQAGRAGAIQETPKPGDPLFERVENIVIGNNALVTDAAV